MPSPTDRAGYRFFTGFFGQRVWREFAYLWLVLLLAPFGFAYAIVSVALGTALAVLAAGLFVLATTVPAARAWGRLHRSLHRSLLLRPIAPPARRPARAGRGYLYRGLTDAPGWRAMLYLFLSFFLSIVGGAMSIALFFVGLGAMTHWYWSQFLPFQRASDGTWHRGAQIAPDVFVDTATAQIAAVVFGIIVFFLLWPALVHGLAVLHGALARGLLGPSRAEERVATLESTRRISVEGADRRLRQLERDLHDGPQAQLVAVAMKLGDAIDRLGRGDDPATIAGLLRSAQDVAQDTLAGVRSLAKGIHPPALDTGLEAGVASLASALPVPLALRVELADRPDPTIESIAYFSIAELVANAVKHAEASRLAVDIRQLGDTIVILVEDDGRGGARMTGTGPDGDSTGLEGLEQRIAAVDGAISIDSPTGGPTRIMITLPRKVRT